MKILIAVDEKTQPATVADFIRKHIWDFPCDFKVIHVVKPVQDGDFVGFLKAPLRHDIIEERRSSGQHMIRRVAIALFDVLHTTHLEEEVLEGDARAAIVRCAQEWKADLIVVSSHINSSIMGLKLGSVSAAVAADAPCSVLLIRAEDKEEPVAEPSKLTVRRIVSG